MLDFLESIIGWDNAIAVQRVHSESPCEQRSAEQCHCQQHIMVEVEDNLKTSWLQKRDGAKILHKRNSSPWIYFSHHKLI